MSETPHFNEATEAQDRVEHEAERAAMRDLWNARHPATPPGSARPAMSDERLTEIRDTPRVLRRIAAELEKVDWSGGSNGQSWLEDAADEYDEMLAEIDRLRASARGETTAEGERDALGRDWLDQSLDTLVISIHAKGMNGHLMPGPARLLLEGEVRSRLASHSRDAAIGAALLEAVKDTGDGRWLYVSHNHACLRIEKGLLTDTEATDALSAALCAASQLRAVSTGKGT